MRGCLEDLKSGGRPMTDKELADHYKHLYSEVKKQKDEVVEYIKESIKHPMYAENIGATCDGRVENLDKLLRMLGEIDDN